MKGSPGVPVIGADPAGLAATCDLAKRSIPVACLEASGRVVGKKKT